MDKIKQQLQAYSPLYSVLTDRVIEFLEPCLDYDVPKCNHKIAFCTCGNSFQFRHPLYPSNAREKRILLEKFCPYCGEPNRHNSPDSPKWLHQGWRMKREPSWTAEKRSQKNQMPTKKYLNCPYCEAVAESYDHKYCTQCPHKLKWRSRNDCANDETRDQPRAAAGTPPSSTNSSKN